MAVAPPRAKAPAARLQQGQRPRNNTEGNADPDAPWGPAEYRKAQAPFAMPAEAYQYDLMYEAFRADKDFWGHWKVVDCARGSPEDSEQGREVPVGARIRVVLDLPHSQKVFPTAYTPSFPTVPAGTPYPEPGGPRSTPGLPLGHSVALDVHILRDVRALLHERQNRGERIDPDLKWLEDIVRRVDGEPPRPGNPRAKHKARRGPEEPQPPQPKPGDRPAPSVRLFSGLLDSELQPMPGDANRKLLSEALRPFSDLYGGASD